MSTLSGSLRLLFVCSVNSQVSVISLTCGHELIGEVVALGPSFRPDATGRPELYSTLRVGDKVVSPFTVSCGECQ